ALASRKQAKAEKKQQSLAALEVRPLDLGALIRVRFYAGNTRRLQQFVKEVTKLWLRQLRRRGQRGRAAWPSSRMHRLGTRYLPTPKILHPYPKDRFRARLAARAV
ncbi:MAG: hypothetical protein ACQESR_14530, partial [Planctomycetota bacterium]